MSSPFLDDQMRAVEKILAEGRSDDARRATKRALRRDKRCIAAWVVLGELEAERGVPKAALVAWSKVPQLDIASGPLVYSQLEATYAALGRARDFETYVRELIAAHPTDGGARRALAGLLAARGDIDTAVGELRRLLGGSGDDLEARAALGRILLAQSRDREAMQEYGALIDVLERRGLLGAGKELE